MQSRSSAFDFPLRQNYPVPMCNYPGLFKMASLDHAGLAGVNPTSAVTFVENHYTDSSYPITQNKIMGCAYILTSEGYQCVYYRAWSTDAGCYGSGMKAAINNLIWIHEKIASATTIRRYKHSTIFADQRIGGKHLLARLNSMTSKTQTISVNTGFGDGVTLHDYAGQEPDETTSFTGRATIVLPVNNGGCGYVAYLVKGITAGFTPVAYSTLQECAGAQDLDIEPADNTRSVTAAKIKVSKGSAVAAQMYYDVTGWTSSTSIPVKLIGPSGATLATQSFKSGGIGTSLDWTSKPAGLYTLQVVSYRTPSANPKPDYRLKATYTAPQTAIPATSTVTGAITTGSQQVYVVGNKADLGNWTSASGFLLNHNGNAVGSGEIELAPSAAVKDKCVKWDRSKAVYEPNQKTGSGNREFTTPASGDATYSAGAS